jgi:hypothetical protein
MADRVLLERSRLHMVLRYLRPRQSSMRDLRNGITVPLRRPLTMYAIQMRSAEEESRYALLRWSSSWTIPCAYIIPRLRAGILRTSRVLASATARSLQEAWATVLDAR